MKSPPGVNFFGELLSVLSDEELIRFGYRLRKVEKSVTAEALEDELEERDGLAAKMNL